MGTVCYNALMPFPRPRFRLSTLLWLTLAVATFFAGIRFERERRRREDEAAAPKKMSLGQWFSSSVAPSDARKSSMSKNGIDADGSDPGEGTGAR
jgi:hypothetical protein